MSPKKIISFISVVTGLVLISLALINYLGGTNTSFVSPLSFKPTPTPKPLPLLEYTFENLRAKPATPSQINLETVIGEELEYTAYQFSYLTDGARMTGQLNRPKSPPPVSGYPVIIMLRGFVDPSLYQTGIGTKNSAAVFAQNGYVTIAPDFLGYGGSDPEDNDSIAARLKRPRNIINLLASIGTLDFINSDLVGMWAHSNGGQIAISVLEISGKPIPTSLWAPVTKPFPYSILYYTDEYDDQGKSLRFIVSRFETDYDVFNYSIDRYWDWLKAPLQLHQGTVDDAVPVEWSDAFVATLKDRGLGVTYFRYEGADHNLRPNWDQAINRDLELYQTHLQ
jgi:uncharacterized protein